jgi:RsiW-degrading membrane proteinase PrsW (M82 family)
VAFFCARQFKKVYNEPIDAFIYMMTAALGFTALENTFYLLAPLLQGDTMGGIMTTNLRFMGASLLHVVASGALAICISYGFYAPTYKKIFFWIYGLILATVLHTLFNYFIIIATEESTFLVFSFVWLTTIILILALERVKAIKKF